MAKRLFLLAIVVLALQYPLPSQALLVRCNMNVKVLRKPWSTAEVKVDCYNCCTPWRGCDVTVQWATGNKTCGGGIIASGTCTLTDEFITFVVPGPPPGAQYVRIVKYCRDGFSYVHYQPVDP